MVVKRADIKRVVKPDEFAEHEGDVVCWAEVELWVPLGGGTSVSQRLRSGGLHGIDVSSSDDPYLNDVFAEELDQLETIIQAMGMTLA